MHGILIGHALCMGKTNKQISEATLFQISTQPAQKLMFKFTIVLSMTFRALHSNRLTELKTEWFDDTPKLKEL